jgi:hypothetical protein
LVKERKPKRRPKACEQRPKVKGEPLCVQKCQEVDPPAPKETNEEETEHKVVVGRLRIAKPKDNWWTGRG